MTLRMGWCGQDAIGDSCENIDDCDDSVCKHYYNEPEIEALCGICKIASKNSAYTRGFCAAALMPVLC